MSRDTTRPAAPRRAILAAVLLCTFVSLVSYPSAVFGIQEPTRQQRKPGGSNPKVTHAARRSSEGKHSRPCVAPEKPKAGNLKKTGAQTVATGGKPAISKPGAARKKIAPAKKAKPALKQKAATGPKIKPKKIVPGQSALKKKTTKKPQPRKQRAVPKGNQTCPT